MYDTYVCLFVPAWHRRLDGTSERACAANHPTGNETSAPWLRCDWTASSPCMPASPTRASCSYQFHARRLIYPELSSPGWTGPSKEASIPRLTCSCRSESQFNTSNTSPPTPGYRSLTSSPLPTFPVRLPPEQTTRMRGAEGIRYQPGRSSPWNRQTPRRASEMVKGVQRHGDTGNLCAPPRWVGWPQRAHQPTTRYLAPTHPNRQQRTERAPCIQTKLHKAPRLGPTTPPPPFPLTNKHVKHLTAHWPPWKAKQGKLARHCSASS